MRLLYKTKVFIWKLNFLTYMSDLNNKRMNNDISKSKTNRSIFYAEAPSITHR
jgi:hypothetical protein